MHRIDAIRTSVGIIGNVISGLLLVSPAPTFWRIFNNKSTEGFHPYPYLATIMTCILSIFIRPDTTPALKLINCFGLAMQIIFLAIFFTYTTKKFRHQIVLLVVEIALFVGISLAIINCFPAHTRERSLVAGTICNVFRLIAYASPLSIVLKVVKTKSAEFLPVWLCLAGFCNGVCWFCYAFVKEFDLSLALGSGLGALFGFIQLGVWFYYTLWGRKESVDSKNKID